MTMHDLVQAAAGGLLIGAASAGVLLLKGRIAGISGIVSGTLFGPREAWRVTFVLGLLLGGLLLAKVAPSAVAAPADRSWPTIVLAGLLVGFGTRHGSGCTSGHGVCGLGRLSPRSGAATATFMATGFATASLVHLLGTGSA